MINVNRRRREPRWSTTFGLLFVASVAACETKTLDGIPNRALDRPMDVAVTCAQVTCIDGTCETDMVPLADCATSGSNCTDYKRSIPGEPGSPQLIGYVANSERNELAVFRQCDRRLVDLDGDAPGHNFIPVGELPTRLTTTGGGCRIVSANRGAHSCDLSVVDGRGVAALALEVEQDADTPSSLVSRLQPLRYDEDAAAAGWQVLGARPGEVVGVPRALSQSKTPDGSSGLGVCSPDEPGSVYVTFPTCDLVAEIDLVNHQIIQSVQFHRDAEGRPVAVDTNVTPVCAVDCPGVFAGGFPEDIPPPSEDRIGIDALALVTPIDELDAVDGADLSILDNTLYLGGLGSDYVIEIPIDDDGRWRVDDIHTLELPSSRGIERIRPTPAMHFNLDGFDEDYQFLYIVAGDGTTRVVKRDFDPNRDALGRECDTQIDPAALDFDPEARVCAPVAEADQLPPVERRAFARGPGMRPRSGARVTDWLFKKQQISPEQVWWNVLGVAVTNAGSVMTSNFHVTRQPRPSYDVVGVFELGLRPHMFMPAELPDVDALEVEQLPSVGNERSVRRAGEDAGLTSRLAPTLRRVDYAYQGTTCQSQNDADPNDPPMSGIPCLPGFVSADQLAAPDGDGSPQTAYYSEPVVRAVAPDHRSWIGGTWELQWEGQVPGTQSTTGRIECDTPGWRGGTCRPAEEGQSRLVDDAAGFCSEGVLPGDKLSILGCTKEGGCGTGQRCLLDPSSRASTGICVSERDYEDRLSELRLVCKPFISDPCGDTPRDYLVTRAFQDELWLQALDIPARSVLVDVSGTDGADVLAKSEIEMQSVCLDEQPDGGCDTNDECQVLHPEAMCVEGLCRRPCADDNECMLRPLPGPECFAEFVSYRVHARNSFLVRGPGSANFLHDRVYVDDDGECRLTDDEGVSKLLTSRIPLGPTDENLGLPWCEDDVEPAFAANPCRIPWPRPANGLSTYHYLSVGSEAASDTAEPITAVRYSNPAISLVLDLTSIDGLLQRVPGEQVYWPHDFRVFRRSRIPQGYSESFRAQSGMGESTTFVASTRTGITQLTLPVRVVHDAGGQHAPGVYVVDSSGPGTGDTIRGQVLRFTMSSTEASLDPEFNGVH